LRDITLTISKPYIIAEIGSNIFKDPDDRSPGLTNGYRQIELAKEHGADAVKFQMFSAEELYGPECRGMGFTYKVDRYALPREWVPHLKEKCDEVGIDFMCSAFSVDGYEYLDPYVKMHKVASPEAGHPWIRNYLMGSSNKPVIWSDGCAIHEWPGAIRMACVSKYPADPGDYNPHPKPGEQVWGLSDHTNTFTLVATARRNGATYFERHVDFLWDDRMSMTPDSPVSFSASNFAVWVSAIRSSEVKAGSRDAAAEKYGRRKTEHGWYRPMPEGTTD
jgi:N-acetylneuraminate synthase